MGTKSKISGIICEFNPLHNGHAALLRHVRHETDGAVVCVMSGNFVQRGEAAVLDKWSRTRLALQNGADLVIELPLPWAMSGAEHFAYGGVFLLDALSCIDELWFGSECGDESKLKDTAEFLLSKDFSPRVKPFLASGMPFAAARSAALKAALGDELSTINEQPNNILGVEYCKALRRLDSGISPRTIKRFEVEHDSQHAVNSFASASLIRLMSSDNADISELVPTETFDRIKELIESRQYPADIRYLERGILAHISTCPVDILKNTADVSEGIENRIRAAAGTVSSLEGLYDAVKTKRYSHARIRRIVLSAYLQLTKALPEAPPYIRILGMTNTGADILRRAEPRLPYVTRPADVKTLDAHARYIFELEAGADDIYALCTENRRPAGMDYTEKMIRM